MASQLLEGLGLASVDKLVRAQRAGIRLFCRRTGESGDLGSKSMGKLYRHVPQASDADNAHAGCGVDAMVANGRVNRDAAAQQRRGPLAFQTVRNRQNETSIDSDTVSITAIALDTGALAIRT